MKTVIETIPHNEQRYDTCGDWFDDANGVSHILVSNCNNIDSELAVAIHELFEKRWCERQGISEQIVTQFDLMFEQERSKGLHSLTDEPGDDPRSPYKEGHELATAIERFVIAGLGLLWPDHCGHLRSLV